MPPAAEMPAETLLRGVVDVVDAGEGWVRPSRLSAEQLRALGSVRAWHPGLFRQMAACAAGVRVEFECDGELATIELRLPGEPHGTRAVLDDVERHAPGTAPRAGAVFADVDGRHLGPLFPGADDVLEIDLSDPGAGGVRCLPGFAEPRRVRVWLPCLAPCELRRVWCDGTFVRPVPRSRQLLVLGDSIAQGFVASDPSRTWCALLADHLGLDLVNQGIGGQVFQPGSLGGLGGLDVAAVVVEFGENYRFEPCSAASVARDVSAYLDEVDAVAPEAPVWVLSCPPHLEGPYPTHPRSCYAEVDRIVTEAVARHERMRLVDAGALLDAARLDVLLADGSDHPGDEGQRQMADRLAFVVDATREDPEPRRERALEAVRAAGEGALPLADALGRGVGEVRLAERGAVIVDVALGPRLVWARDRKLLRRALTCLGGASVSCVCGTREAAREAAREVARASGGRARACEIAVWRSVEPTLEVGLDLRTLTPAYVGAIKEHYSHPEYLAPGELEALLGAGRVIGAFEDGRLVGFVGEHPHGSMGMLEVLEDARRRGWGRALTAAKVLQLLGEGRLPWAEIWPDNRASRALAEKLGFSWLDEGSVWFVS